MKIIISETKQVIGKNASGKGAELIREAISERGEAIIIVATGASQFEMLKELVKEDIDWSKITGFHLDEYIGISQTHPALIMRRHEAAWLFLDKDSASMLS